MNEWGPFCCEETSRWVDNGPTLQYYYCDVCKKEVSSAQSSTGPAGEPYILKEYSKGFAINSNALKWTGPPILGRKSQQRALDEEAAKLRSYLATTTQLIDPPSKYYPRLSEWIVNKTDKDNQYLPLGTLVNWPANSHLPKGWERWYA